MATPNRPVKAIIFDCFGVLTSSPWLELLGSLPPQQLEPARALNYQVDAGQITQDAYIQGVADLIGSTKREVEHRLIRRGDKNIQLLDYIVMLKAKYKIGLLSNVSTNWIRDSFLSPDELALFDDTVMSYEVKLVKPQIEIFELAANRLKCNIGECVLVDDNPVNCHAAKATGMRAVRYENFVQFKRQLSELLSDF